MNPMSGNPPADPLVPFQETYNTRDTIFPIVLVIDQETRV